MGIQLRYMMLLQAMCATRIPIVPSVAQYVPLGDQVGHMVLLQAYVCYLDLSCNSWRFCSHIITTRSKLAGDCYGTLAGYECHMDIRYTSYWFLEVLQICVYHWEPSCAISHSFRAFVSPGYQV